ncbi:Flp pilus assembly secretin CpaC [Ochrobactrum sp. 19YEA23]|nr:Flp pilus assembly secretin CpaC [Ochrobactrum sp. 19YEA23]
MVRRFFSSEKLRKAFVLAAIVLSSAGIQTAHAEEYIKLETSRARILRLARPADTVVIGNPAIADAVVQDSQTIVLTGKDFGVTNIVVMDKQGEPIIDRELVVSSNGRGTTRVYRRAEVQTLSCTPYCEKASTKIGDDK